MFKNLVIYRLASEGLPGLAGIEDALHKARFVPCGLTQQQSCGWVPPRGVKHGPLAEAVAGQIILKLQVEQRILPAAVIKRRVDEIALNIEQETGRNPGKKQTKELKEQAMLELLPMAFTRQSGALVWIDRAAGLLLVDSSGQGAADELVGFLVKTLQTVAVSQLHTATSPAMAMADWLISGEPPASFTVDRDLTLKSCDEMKARVRYDRHLLDTDEVRQHITGGKVPTLLALTWEGRVSFVLTDTMQVKKLTFLDVVFEGQKAISKDEAFDADAAIATGELAHLLPALVEALGGEHIVAAKESTPPTAAPDAHIGEGDDPLYEQALAIVRAQGKPSISLVQRHLRIGYNRAARLLEAMEQAGAVSPMQSNGTRTVLEAA